MNKALAGIGALIASLALSVILFPNGAVAQQLVRVNLTLIGGSTPAATNPLPVRISDGSSFTTLASDSTHDSAAGSTGPQVMAECDDTSTDPVDEGDAARLRINCTNRALLTYQLDPCTSNAKTYFSVDIVTATTTEVTPSLAGASTNYYICSINLVAGGANNVALVDDDSDNCGSITSGMAGGTTAAEGWNFAANGGLTLGNGQGSVAKTNGANRVVCLVTSAAVQLSGTISYVAAP
jgi:hypothetical protein